MSGKRRDKSLHLNLSDKPLTPDFASAVVVQVKPDTKVEKALYKMLLNERQKNARLEWQIRNLRNSLRQRKVWSKIKHLFADFTANRNPEPKSKSKE